jgi:hypothetical protein
VFYIHVSCLGTVSVFVSISLATSLGGIRYSIDDLCQWDLCSVFSAGGVLVVVLEVVIVVILVVVVYRLTLSDGPVRGFRVEFLVYSGVQSVYTYLSKCKPTNHDQCTTLEKYHFIVDYAHRLPDSTRIRRLHISI